MTITVPTSPQPASEPVTFLELEITRACELRCSHCYSNSGPAAGTGAMTLADWMHIIEQAAGHPDITTVQFIGGDPLDHPAFAELVEYALLHGLRVAVFTNLYRVSDRHWGVLARKGVRVSTSWYSADRTQHDSITGVRGSFDATWANIAAARRMGIEVKVGMVQVIEGQDVEGGAELLKVLGVTDISLDRARPVGRAAPRGVAATDDDLCGRGRAAIDTDGRLMPCVLGRHHSAGDVREVPLADLLDSPGWKGMVSSIHGHGSCTPADSNDCDPSR
ncbi:radical SAM/SPASM domain-containing protein [Actinomadura formosensis]|uniref:radical SAM/SPASM domain-containing protein n=1 Tax=Actinomadura formosensis TaxID=60706 RepID=UPI003D8E4D4D